LGDLLIVGVHADAVRKLIFFAKGPRKGLKHS
jgi:hypothetical protein